MKGPMNERPQTDQALGFQPAAGHVLVRLAAAERAGAPPAVEWADVVAVGPVRPASGSTLPGPTLAPGDRIAVRPGSAIHLRLRGQAFAVIDGSDVLGVLRPEKPGPLAPEPAAEAEPPNQAAPAAPPGGSPGESPETDVAPDLLDRETPTAEDLH